MSRLAMAATIILALAFGGYGVLQPEIEAQTGGDTHAASAQADYGYSPADYGHIDYEPKSAESSACSMKKAGYGKMAGRSKSCSMGAMAAAFEEKSCGSASGKPMSTYEAMGLTADAPACDDKLVCPDGTVCEPDDQVAEESNNVDLVAQQASDTLLYLFATPESAQASQSTSLSRALGTTLPVTR